MLKLLAHDKGFNHLHSSDGRTDWPTQQLPTYWLHTTKRYIRVQKKINEEAQKRAFLHKINFLSFWLSLNNVKTFPQFIKLAKKGESGGNKRSRLAGSKTQLGVLFTFLKKTAKKKKKEKRKKKQRKKENSPKGQKWFPFNDLYINCEKGEVKRLYKDVIPWRFFINTVWNHRIYDIIVYNWLNDVQLLLARWDLLLKSGVLSTLSLGGWDSLSFSASTSSLHLFAALLSKSTAFAPWVHVEPHFDFEWYNWASLQLIREVTGQNQGLLPI